MRSTEKTFCEDRPPVGECQNADPKFKAATTPLLTPRTTLQVKNGSDWFAGRCWQQLTTREFSHTVQVVSCSRHL